eukprot:1156767-Pelagomonas_calceolata.AAC.2
MPGIREHENFLLDKKQIAKVPHKPANDMTARQQLPGSNGKTETGAAAGVYHPMSDLTNIVEPNSDGITDTVGRAELDNHSRKHMCQHRQPQLTYQLRKQILYPKKHRHYVQGDVLKTISNLAHTSQGQIFFCMVKSHAGRKERLCRQ